MSITKRLFSILGLQWVAYICTVNNDRTFKNKHGQFSVPTREQLAPANQTIFDNLQKALGFVPNLYAVIGYISTGLGKYLAYQNAKTSLSNKEKEAVTVIVSQVNGCI